MKRALVKFRNSAFQKFIKKHQKYAPILFFIGGFIFDSLTLGRIDRLYDLSVLCSHMTSLTITIYLYNLSGDGKWTGTFLERFEEYFPLAIQFFFGGLSSAYVVYFSRSVSLTKTATFFIILIVLLLANELLKKRISNKYLQFSVYFFISFTFFTFMVPVFIKEMSTEIFLLSGCISFISTSLLIAIIYKISPSTRSEIHLGKLIGLIVGIYALINSFYFLRLIPPVPLALNDGIVAHNVESIDGEFVVTFETDDWYVFWRNHRLKYIHSPGENIYVFSSIFAPTSLEKTIFHRWKWYNNRSKEWEKVEDIGYKITGGRDGGYRGYTYKNNVKSGDWKVEVLTKEEHVLGIIEFEIVINDLLNPNRMKQRKF
ncbi:MAG: DUF2914 domain-containing protein [Ekhidna sp.]